MTELDATAGSAVSFSDLPSAMDDAPALGAKNSESLLEEFEIEVDEKVKQMRSLTDMLALRLKNDFDLELLKLPASIRSMTMQEFCVQYGGDIDEALKKQSKLMAPPPAPPKTEKPAPTPANKSRPQRGGGDGPHTQRKTRGGPALTETPVNGKRETSRSRAPRPSVATPAVRGGMQTPGGPSVVPSTPMWTPRMQETPRFVQRGETQIFSRNGSPINLYEGVKATVKRNRSETMIHLAGADGNEVVLDPSGVHSHLPDDESRAMVLSQLDALEKQIKAVKREINAN